MVRLLSLLEVMTRLGLSRPTVTRLIESGKLPAVNVGCGEKTKRWVVREDVLVDFLTPATVKKREEREQRRRRIDADVPKVF